MTKTRTLIILAAIFIIGIAVSSIPHTQKENSSSNEKPTPTPEGILVNELPREADIVFVSIRYVLDEVECLDSNFKVKYPEDL
jgi:hypothetical protein